MSTKLLAEAIGSFFLASTIAITDVEPFSTGGTYWCAMIFTGFVSGAHYNPAITFAVMIKDWMEDKLDQVKVKENLLMMVSQFIGALFGILIGWGISTRTIYFEVADGYQQTEGFFSEFIFTAVLCADFIMVSKITDNIMIGSSVIAMAVTSGEWAIGKISKGCFNPTICLAANIVNYAHTGSNFTDTWIYILAPMIAAIFSGMTAKMFLSELDEQKKAIEEAEEKR
ncbi:unnamed protein product [Blepharisma stoltei]|uniref:Aquaporin n=1 Tax=Blepharisma stoltei TaxID=1481888 RepID=A0AAU9K6J7_9CILI|nr:unnamed protein product [Blepharisma stoltei]